MWIKYELFYYFYRYNFLSIVSQPNLKIMPKKILTAFFCYKQTTPMAVLHMNPSFVLKEIPSELLTLKVNFKVI